MNLYAIRHIPTNNYLPSRLGRARGYTFDEPQPMGKMIPRLFTSERNARMALRAWLRGEHKPYWDVDGGTAGVGEIKPVPSRKAEEMEVVRMILI
jgi:hypothetical protein